MTCLQRKAAENFEESGGGTSAEDPVCGSAHCQIADYWSREYGRVDIHAYQASKRGGHLYCRMLENGRIAISGEAALVAVSEIVAEL